MKNFKNKLEGVDFQRVALWVLMIISLFASMRHVAWLFSTLELGGVFGGWLSAFSFDAGVLVLTMMARRYKEGSAQRRFIRAGIYLNALITVPANIMHGIEHQLELARVSGWMWLAIPFLFSVAIPAMVIFLAEVLSRQEEEIEKEQLKEQLKQKKRARQGTGQELVKTGQLDGQLSGQLSGQLGRAERLDLVVKAVVEGKRSRSEIVEYTGIPKGSVSNLLNELYSQNRLHKNESDQPEPVVLTNNLTIVNQSESQEEQRA